MPDLIRLYIRSVLIGFFLAALLVGLLLGFNLANLRHLVTQSSDGPLALFLLWFFNGIVFAGVQFGIAIMGMSSGDDDDDYHGGGGLREPALIPIPIRSDTRRRP